MHILSLEIKGFKIIELMHLDLDGKQTRLTGDNEAGKSSVFDSITWALTGKGVTNPIKKGEEKVSVKLGIGADAREWLIERRATTKSGNTGSLIVTDASGAQTPAAQTFVNELISARTLDPLSIYDMTKTSEGNKKLIVTLLDLLGLTDKMQKLDMEIAGLFETRKGVNRDEKSLETRCDAIEVPKDTPDVLVDVAKLTGDLQTCNSQLEGYRTRQRDLESDKGEAARADKRVVELEAELKKAKAYANDRAKAVVLRQKAVDEMSETADRAAGHVAIIQQQMVAATTINQHVGRKLEKSKLRGELLLKMREAEKLTSEIETRREQKVKMVQTAKLPIKGLAFAEDSLLYDGIPLGDLNTASKIRVCCALAMAEKPALRVIFIKEAALVNQETFKTICDIAVENGFQVMAEHFSVAPLEGSIHIVEGAIV